jgi:hypothetical protein
MCVEDFPAYASFPAQLAQITDSTLTQYLDQVNLGHPQPWPSAADYAVLGMVQTQGALQSLGGNADLDPSALQTGDVLAWGLPLDDNDTGHVVVLAEPPAEAGGTWSVQVYDSSLIPHAADQRPGGTTGVGRGTIAFQLATDLPGQWQVNFDLNVDSWHSVPYLSGLRLT